MVLQSILEDLITFQSWNVLSWEGGEKWDREGTSVRPESPVSRLLLWKAGTHALCQSPGDSMTCPAASFPLRKEAAGVLIDSKSQFVATWRYSCRSHLLVMATLNTVQACHHDPRNTPGRERPVLAEGGRGWVQERRHRRYLLCEHKRLDRVLLEIISYLCTLIE